MKRAYNKGEKEIGLLLLEEKSYLYIITQCTVNYLPPVKSGFRLADFNML